MTFDEYIDLRLQNGKLCDGYRLENGKRVRTDPYSKSLPADMRHLIMYGKNMKEFWANAKSQRDLLWVLRGIGKDDIANELWKSLCDRFGIVLHRTVITVEEAHMYADIVRQNCLMPIELEE